MTVFEVTSKRRGDIMILQVRGRVTTETEDLLIKAFRGVGEDGVPHLLLDLDDVEYINSIGMGAIIHCLRHRRAVGGRMAVVCAREALLRAFRVLNFDSVLPLRKTEADAIAFLRGKTNEDEEDRAS